MSVPIDTPTMHTLPIILTGAVIGLNPGGAASSIAICSTS